MKRTTLGVAALVGVAFACLVSFAPAAAAGDFALDGACEDDGMRFKFGASGQAYIWRNGGC